LETGESDKHTSFQLHIKSITKDYLQMYKTVQLFTSTFTFNTSKYRSIKVIKNTYEQIL